MIERFLQVATYYSMEAPKNLATFIKNAYLSVSAVIFCEQFLAYIVHIGRSAFLSNP